MKLHRLQMIKYSALAVSCLWTSSTLHAQVMPVPDDANSGEIVVTAQKRSERLIDVPAAVTALSPDALRALGAVRFEDYQAYIPGLSTTPVTPGFTQIQLRGVTSGATQLSSTVATYFNDAATNSSSSIAFGSKLTPDPDLLDVERIEILRGPQGTLYGANALGGVIRYILVAPNLNETQGHVETGVSTVAHGGTGYVARGAVSTPLVSGVLGLRASGFYTEDPGFIDNVITGRNNVNRSTNWGGRVALLWRPNDDVSVTLSSLYQHRDNDGKPSETVDQALEPANGAYNQAIATSEHINTRYQLHILSIDADLGFASLVSSTSFGRQKSFIAGDESQLWSGLGFPFPLWTNQVNVDLKKFAQELRLSSPQGQALEYVAGGYFTREVSNAQNRIHAVTSADALTPQAFPSLVDATIASRYKEIALFANVTYNFTDRFNLQVGGRWSRNDQRFAEEAGGLLYGPMDVSLSTNSSESAWTYAVAPQFKITPDVNVYARVAKGFRPGGGNLVAPALLSAGVNATYGSDSLINYEIGAKAAAFDRRLNLSLAAFQIDWKDIQTAAFADSAYYLLNGGKARSKGVEAEARWHADGLTLGGNVSFIDAKSRDAIPSVGAQAGDRLPYSPRWSAAASADYVVPIGDGLEGSLGASLRYAGSRQAYYSLATPSNPGDLRLDDYVMIDLRASLRRGPYAISAYIQNVTDKRAILNARTEEANPATGAGWRAFIARPRTAGVSLSADF